MIYRLGRIEIGLKELLHFSYSYFANRFFWLDKVLINIFGSCNKKYSCVYLGIVLSFEKCG